MSNTLEHLKDFSEMRCGRKTSFTFHERQTGSELEQIEIEANQSFKFYMIDDNTEPLLL